MSKCYSHEVIQEACSLYISGLSPEDVAVEMKRGGSKGPSGNTVRRWIHKYKLKQAQLEYQGENVKAGLLLESQLATNDLLETALIARKKITDNLSSRGITPVEAVGLLKKTDALISTLVNTAK